MFDFSLEETIPYPIPLPQSVSNNYMVKVATIQPIMEYLFVINNQIEELKNEVKTLIDGLSLKKERKK